MTKGDIVNTNSDNRTIKRIKEELPILMKKDGKIRQWITQLADEQVTKKTDEMETRTESKFDIILEELRKDREEQEKKWEKNQEELKKFHDEFEKSRADFKAEMKELRDESKAEMKELHDEFEKSRVDFKAEMKELRADFKEELEKSRKYYERKYDTTLGALGARWGLHSEASFRNGLKGILEDLELKVEHIDEYDCEGIVHGRPGSVEMDVIIKNGILMLCELKSSVSRADMFEFYKKTIYYEKKYHRKGDRLIVISPMVEEKAMKVADELGVKVYSFAEDIREEFTA